MDSLSDPSNGLRFAATYYTGAYFPLIISLQFGVQSHHSFSDTTFRVVPLQFGVQNHYIFSVMTFRVVFLDLTFTVIVAVLVFRATISSRLRHLKSSFLASRSQLSVLVWRSEPLFLHGIHSYYLRFGVQSHIFIFGILSLYFSLAFRVVVFFWRLESLFDFSSVFVAIIDFFSVWHSKPWFVLSLAFRAAISYRYPKSSPSSVQHSEPLFIFRLAFRVTSSLWHSEPLLIFGQASEPLLVFSSAFRATPSVQRSQPHFVSFDVKSHIFVSAFRATLSVRRSEPYFISFGVHSHIFVSAFRAITCLRLGVQSHTFILGLQSRIFILVFRAFICSQFDTQNPHVYLSFGPSPFSSIMAFRAIGHTHSGLFLSHFFSLVLAFRAVFHTHSCILSHFFSQSRRSEPLFYLAFNAIIIFLLVLAFRAVVRIHSGTLSHHFLSSY